jgi:type VI secretion system protein ImpL
MVWILAALVALIAWALWFVLDLALWIPIVATAVVVLAAIGIFIFRKVRAASAAKGLERALAAQGMQHAANARPERRAEIQELARQMQGGISALKGSKLGGGRSGAGALYSLPWYVIIGPPGAGKTTALKHSGLVFPHDQGGGGGGVRGVGGTRNCDWWFTNEAILLDTAGRYTTEQDDRDEWISFLGMLRKFRSRRPINGILVAISIGELVDANEQQIEATGKKIRARIDEVMTELHMVVPVYLLFTKVDLVAGFVEFFGDMVKSTRNQAWGTTFRLSMPKNQPGHMFAVEFDTLVKQLHARALKRLSQERNREAREKIFQFPLEMAATKNALAELVNTIFQVNSFQGTPIFRGFYFTSGTQEGLPLERVLGRMGAAMGIRPAQQAQARPQVEPKSYFLHDVFMNVVFPDGDVAARSESEVRRQRVMRVAVAGAALALSLIVAVPSVVSFFNNRAFLAETEQRMRAVAAIQWGDGRPATDKVAVLAPALERLHEIDDYREEGVPFGMGWLMYQGEEVYRPAVRTYVYSVQQGFAQPVKLRLEERLKVIGGQQYLRERTDLKTYLMLSDIENLDVEWATGRLTQVWAEMLRATTNVPEAQLIESLTPHVKYYLELLKSKRVEPLPPATELIATARRTLAAVPVRKRYYDQFVNVLVDEKYDETKDNARANKKYPPLSLGELFLDRPDVLKVVSGARFAKEKRWQEVEGPYTDKGHLAVVKHIAVGRELLESEQWVVPLGEDEKGDRVTKNLGDLAADYEEQYIRQWSDFLADIVIKEPGTLKEAVDTYALLAQPEWPYLRILRALEDHTQWKKDQGALEDNSDKAGAAASKALSAKVKLNIKVDLKSIAGRASRVPAVFKRTVEFGVPQGSAAAPVTDTPLAKYLSRLGALRDEMQRTIDSTPSASPAVMSQQLTDASKEADAMLQPFDDKARQVLKPLLLSPLRVGGRAPAGLRLR